MGTITLELDDQYASVVRDMAARTGLSEKEVVRIAVEFYSDSFDRDAGELPRLTDDELASIRRGIAEAERGEGVRAEDLLSKLREQYRK